MLDVPRSHTPNRYLTDYEEQIRRLKARLSLEDALKTAVGGEFVAIGQLERALLQQFGLNEEPAFVIDVGCGSGRLAAQLASEPQLRYLGVDIVPELLEFACKLCSRPDWAFKQTDGTTIPANENQADFVCFFSVFTHLLHQDTFRYLTEAQRVLKPGGLIVFTFLEYRIPSHWTVFHASLDSVLKNAHLDQFISRDGIEAWASHLGLEIVTIEDGDKPHIRLSFPVRFDDGRVMEGKGHFGQSVTVLRKRAA